jgi:Protein of unknown function (DUF1269)
MQAVGTDFALVVFDHTGGAERAYADAPRRARGIDWAQEVAFVEHHSRARLVIRGSFAGHYVDADDYDGFIGPRVAEGTLAGGAAGLLFGPAGLAAGLVAGGIAGGVSTEHSGPKLRSALFDELRSEVPEGSSAIIQFASADHVDAMVEALDPAGGRLVRHHLEPETARVLEDAVATSPAAAGR